MNAPQIAEQRGIAVRETKSSDARDYVNLIVVRGDQGTHVAATLFGKQQAPRIVGIDGHSVDLPPARHMLVVHNDDVPGVIGRVGIDRSATPASTSPTWTSARARAAKPR